MNFCSFEAVFYIFGKIIHVNKFPKSLSQFSSNHFFLWNLHIHLSCNADLSKSSFSNLENLQKELPLKEQEMQKARVSLDSTKTRASTITGNLRKYQSQLEEKRYAMRAHRSNNRVLNFLMQMKSSGKAPGIFGRLVSILYFTCRLV